MRWICRWLLFTTIYIFGVSYSATVVQTTPLPSSEAPDTTISNGTLPTIGLTTVAYNDSSEVATSWCYRRKSWNERWIRRCYTPKCATHMFSEFNRFMTCNSPRKTDDILLMAQRVHEYTLRLAKDFTKTESVDVVPTKYQTYKTTQFLAGIGYIHRGKTILTERSEFPSSTDVVAKSWDSLNDKISLSRIELQSGVTAYAWVIYKELRPKNERQGYKVVKSFLQKEVEEFYTFPKSKAETVLNSYVISLATDPVMLNIGDIIEITINHRELKQRKNHKCVYLVGPLGSGHWTTAGCHSLSTNRFRSICRCSSVGTYGVISEVEKAGSKTKTLTRTMLTVVFCVSILINILLLLVTIIFPIKKDCLHFLRIKLHVAHDTTLLMEYIILLFGIFLSDNVAISGYISSILNFVHISVMGWVLSEGIHCYHSVVPVYDADVINPMFFYSSIAIGVPAAFTGSCTGYNYNFTTVLEFSWISVNSGDLNYFLAAPITIISLTLLVMALIGYELNTWIGSKNDYGYRKAVEYIKRFFVLILMMGTWYSGIIARRRAPDSGFVYIFMGLLLLQAVMAFSFHFLKNSEIWENGNQVASQEEEAPINDAYSISMSKLSFRNLEDDEKSTKHEVRCNSEESLNTNSEKEKEKTNSDESSSSSGDTDEENDASDEEDENNSIHEESDYKKDDDEGELDLEEDDGDKEDINREEEDCEKDKEGVDSEEGDAEGDEKSNNDEENDEKVLQVADEPNGSKENEIEESGENEDKQNTDSIADTENISGNQDSDEKHDTSENNEKCTDNDSQHDVP